MSRAVVTSKKPVLITLTIALLFHTALVSVQTRRRIDTSFVRTAILDSIAPMEKLVDRMVHGIGYVWQGYFALVGVHKENEALRKELDRLRMVITQQNEEVMEARRLRELLSMTDPGLGKTAVARVIGRDPARANQTVTIDKGTIHGVQRDSAVITAQGIVGRVIHASNYFAIVQLITDSQSGVGVMLRSTRQQGVLVGTGNGLDLDHIDDDNDLKEGEEFITSGQDRIYPKGLSVGFITAVGPRRSLFRSVEIRPSVDFELLEEVICILERPQSIDDIDPAQGPPSP